MPHKCTKCGREFEDGSTEILKGCPSCGGKKFLYVSHDERHRDVLEEKSVSQIAEETKREVLEVAPPTEGAGPEVHRRVESVRIMGPGSYELNLEKMAESDEVVIGIGKEGKYAVDIVSMMKPVKKLKKKPRVKKKEKGKGKG
ncbi:MAG: Zn-ribbon domain-containing protein [Methanomicrobiales archaeon]|nr:Zn-ribbon domain-containing protein [Methanomicrobiales archaeon]